MLEVWEKSGLHWGKFSLSSEANGLEPPLLAVDSMSKKRGREGALGELKTPRALSHFYQVFKFQISSFSFNAIIFKSPAVGFEFPAERFPTNQIAGNHSQYRRTFSTNTINSAFLNLHSLCKATAYERERKKERKE